MYICVLQLVQLSDPHISDLSTGLHLVTLFLDDDWAGTGASPHVVHTLPKRVTP